MHIRPLTAVKKAPKKRLLFEFTIAARQVQYAKTFYGADGEIFIKGAASMVGSQSLRACLKTAFGD